MKKVLLLFIIVFSISFSLNNETNKTWMIKLVVNNSIDSVVKIKEIMCPRSIIPDNLAPDPNYNYEYCVAEIEFLQPKKINACTYTKKYCVNFTVKEILSDVHPTLWPLLFNDSIKKYYNETLDSDIFIVDKTYFAKLKFVGGVFQLIYVEKEKYNINIFEIVIYLLIIGIAYYLYKLKKSDKK